MWFFSWDLLGLDPALSGRGPVFRMSCWWGSMSRRRSELVILLFLKQFWLTSIISLITLVKLCSRPYTVCVCVHTRVHTLSHSVVSESLWPHGLYVAHQAPLSLGFPRQEYWRGLPFPSPGDLPDPEVEPTCPASQADSLPSEPPRKRSYTVYAYLNQLFFKQSC